MVFYEPKKPDIGVVWIGLTPAEAEWLLELVDTEMERLQREVQPKRVWDKLNKGLDLKRNADDNWGASPLEWDKREEETDG